MSKKIILLLAAIITFACVSAKSLQSYKGKVKNGYNFWLSAPAKTDSIKKPLVIFLHGASLQGSNLNKVLRYGTLDAISKGLDIDGYVMAPQTIGAWQPQKVMNTADYVIASHSDIDTDRIYVIGMSLGGYGTIDMAATYPDRIAAAIAMCGGASVKNLEGLGDVPLWIIHGTADAAVSVSQSDRVVSAIKNSDSKGERLTYDRVPGMNHSQPARMFYLPESYDWLFKHRLSDKDRNIADTFTVNGSTLKSAYAGLKFNRRSSGVKRSSKSAYAKKSSGKRKRSGRRSRA